MERTSISDLSFHRNRQLANAKAKWRQAATIVSMRWDTFLRSETESRTFAFKSYLAALDAEEAAAADVSRLLSGTAGYRSAA